MISGFEKDFFNAVIEKFKIQTEFFVESQDQFQRQGRVIP